MVTKQSFIVRHATISKRPQLLRKRIRNTVVSIFSLLAAGLYIFHGIRIEHVIGDVISIRDGRNTESENQCASKVPLEHLIDVHQSDYPSFVAGRWVYRPSEALRYSAAHLKCLAPEANGNCWEDTSYMPKKTRNKKRARYDAVQKGIVANSPGILNASDPYVWVSEDPAYRVANAADTALIRRLVKGRRFFLIGDSLTREWFYTLRCEFEHILKSEEDGIQYLKYFNGPFDENKFSKFFANATDRDYVIFNVGHHTDLFKPGMEKTWKQNYTYAMNQFLSRSYAPIPDKHVYFRTTSVRHFQTLSGDRNVDTLNTGDIEPKMKTVWSDYGRTQPAQNLIGMDMVSKHSNYQILDTSPLMLSRADASSDGSHMCIPGPLAFWGQMLFYRILQEEGGSC
jgi:hypothetical protein